MLAPCMTPFCGHRAVTENLAYDSFRRPKGKDIKPTATNHEFTSKTSSKKIQIFKLERETDREQWTEKQGTYDVHRGHLRKNY